MQISSQIQPSPVRLASTPGGPGQPDKTLVERIVDKTVLSANYMASGLAGGVGGLGAYGRSVLGTTAGTTVSAWTNLWKAETIGPNLKILGSMAALPALAVAAVVALPVSLGAGIYHGGDQVDSSKPRELTVGQGAVQGYGKTREGWEKAAAGMKESLEHLGTEKLQPGEKPLDIPIIKLGKTLAVGAASAAVGGVAGVVCAVVSSGRQVVDGVVKAFKDENLNLPGKLIAGAGAVVGGVVQGTTYGMGSAVSILGKGLSETWKKDSVVEGSKAMLDRAARTVAAAAAPRTALLQEVADQPAPPTQP